MTTRDEPKHRLFVYGTLKNGFTNYERYLSLAIARGGAVLLGEGATIQKLPLVIRPINMNPPTCGPVLMDSPAAATTGHRIAGEVYIVDANVLEAMDILEGIYTTGAYYKRTTDIEIVSSSSSTTTLECTVYFYPPCEELLKQKLLPGYTAEEHALYVPSPKVNSHILSLCAQDRAGLATMHQADMTTHCLRLLPGDDLVLSLVSFVRMRGLAAAVVLTCVGSTGCTVLRPAGSRELREFDGKHEIVSLTGMVSAEGGHHLHGSFSTAECTVFGGHCVEGTIVRTTAEIALGVVSGGAFKRRQDPRSGFSELYIKQNDTADQHATSQLQMGEHNLKRLRGSSDGVGLMDAQGTTTSSSGSGSGGSGVSPGA